MTAHEVSSQKRIPATDSLHILVVDDEVTNRELLSQILAFDGHKVTLASSGIEALKIFQANIFDLVVTDLFMPEMKGDAFSHEIKKISSNMPIVMLTGFGDTIEDLPQEHEAADVVVAKPIKINALREAIAQIKIKYCGANNASVS